MFTSEAIWRYSAVVESQPAVPVLAVHLFKGVGSWVVAGGIHTVTMVAKATKMLSHAETLQAINLVNSGKKKELTMYQTQYLNKDGLAVYSRPEFIKDFLDKSDMVSFWSNFKNQFEQ